MMTQTLWNLDGRAALVTGGGAGIGRACVEMLAKAGADVMIADRDIETATQTAQVIARETGRDVRAVACDILRDEQLVNAVDSTLAAFGRINILVNIAGGGGGG